MPTVDPDNVPTPADHPAAPAPETQADIAQEAGMEMQKEMGIRAEDDNHGGPEVDPVEHKEKNEDATREENAAQPNGGQPGMQPKDHLSNTDSAEAVITSDEVPYGGPAQTVEPKVY